MLISFSKYLQPLSTLRSRYDLDIVLNMTNIVVSSCLGFIALYNILKEKKKSNKIKKKR